MDWENSSWFKIWLELSHKNCNQPSHKWCLVKTNENIYTWQYIFVDQHTVT